MEVEMTSKRWITLSLSGAAILAASAASAAPPDAPDGGKRRDAAAREECLDAHARGQEQKERGQLVRAKQTFLGCAQSACPALVQADCARFGEELAQLVPTVTFGARDARAADLPLTTVYVDDSLTASRLDDGRAYELDPGKHSVRFVHDGKETTLRVVLSQGEKGRVLLATFLDGGPKPASTASSDVVDPPPETTRPNKLPLVVAGLGGVAAIGGGVLLGLGLSKVPAGCSIASTSCVGPTDDPSLGEARSAVAMANTGIAVGVVGLVTIAGALVWYFVQPPTDTRRGSARPLQLEF
jgi:hypothetical protein